MMLQGAQRLLTFAVRASSDLTYGCDVNPGRLVPHHGRAPENNPSMSSSLNAELSPQEGGKHPVTRTSSLICMASGFLSRRFDVRRGKRRCGRKGFTGQKEI